MADEIIVVATEFAAFARRPHAGVAASLEAANADAAPMAPDLDPPSVSNSVRARSADTSSAHCLRASASNEWASSTTQFLTGGRIAPSASTFLSSSEWFVTTMSAAAARRRAPWSMQRFG